MIILTIIVFILILALLVLGHEFGHFIMAKRSGMAVEEFGFGFPPRLFSIRKGETLYSFNLLPLGGFVKILGENQEELESSRSFANKGFWARLGTLVAGVFMNFVIAWVLLSIGFGIGLPNIVAQGDTLPAHAHLRSEAITVLQVAPNSPASKAGLQEGDNIISVDHKTFSDLDSMVTYVKSEAGHNVDMQLMRGNESLDKQVFSRANPPADQGAIGIALGNVGRISFPWYLTPVVGFKATINLISDTATGFWTLIVHHQGLSDVGGPVRIAALTNQVTKLGIVYILQFAALLSVNLGIINLIPFPALDGGRALFLIIEKIRGKRNNQQVEQWVNTIGFALLMALILFISFRDVRFLIHK